MRAAVLLVVLLVGCFSPNDQVYVSIDNQTNETQSYELVAWWDDGGEAVKWGEATGTVDGGESGRLFSFLRPCEDRLVGTLVYMGALGNGTSVVWEQEWDQDGCQEQHVVLVLEPQRARFSATYG